MLEEIGAVVRDTSARLVEQDDANMKKRKWLESLRKKKEKEEKERIKKEKEAAKKAAEEEKKRFKEEAKKFNTKTRGKVVNGNQVFVRNEQLTMRVGKLDSHWEKKLDAKTGRCVLTCACALLCVLTCTCALTRTIRCGSFEA